MSGANGQAVAAARADESFIRGVLEQAGVQGWKGKACRCPFHDDKHASAGVYEKEGVWRFACQVPSCGVGGDVFDLQARLASRPVADILREFSQAQAATSRVPAKPVEILSMAELVARYGPLYVKVFPYTHPTTRRVELVACRVDHAPGDKDFYPHRPVAGGFVVGAPAKPWPIYNRARVAAAESVIVVEGEGKVHILHDLGFTATSTYGGAGKAVHADLTPLAGKTLYLWADNDEKGTGVSHMDQVAEICGKLNPPATIYRIRHETLDLPWKGDVKEFVARYSDKASKRAAVAELVAGASSTGASDGVRQLIEDTISGKRESLGWPWNHVNRLTQALLPGKVTVICGAINAGKSLWILEAAAMWVAMGRKVALYELEDTKTDHLYRRLAQLVGDSMVSSAEWVRANGDKARAMYREHQEELDRLGTRMWTAPGIAPSLPEMAKWVEERVAEGCELIIVDPITACGAGQARFVDDSAFLARVKAAVEPTDSRLILMTHPRMGGVKRADLDSMAGGLAFARFSHTVMWLQAHDPPAAVRVQDGAITQVMKCNRSVKLCKTRNAKGEGLVLGFTLDKSTLCFQVHGVIQKDGEQ